MFFVETAVQAMMHNVVVSLKESIPLKQLLYYRICSLRDRNTTFSNKQSEFLFSKFWILLWATLWDAGVKCVFASVFADTNSKLHKSTLSNPMGCRSQMCIWKICIWQIPIQSFIILLWATHVYLQDLYFTNTNSKFHKSTLSNPMRCGSFKCVFARSVFDKYQFKIS